MVAIRRSERELRAFYNVCKRRTHYLLEGEGTAIGGLVWINLDPADVPLAAQSGQIGAEIDHWAPTLPTSPYVAATERPRHNVWSTGWDQTKPATPPVPSGFSTVDYWPRCNRCDSEEVGRAMGMLLSRCGCLPSPRGQSRRE